MKLRFSHSLPVALLLCCSNSALAFDAFDVADIKVEGVQRISQGTVFNYLPAAVGDRMDGALARLSIEKLYETGFFDNIELRRDGDVLVVDVKERPSIASILIDGNNEIPSEDLIDGLKKLGLAEGRIFDRALLDQIQQDLQRQYYALGFYSIEIETELTEIDQNRVDISIEVKEGEVAKIRRINIIGNDRFDEDELQDDFQLGLPAWYALFSSKDQYSKQKLSADIETLRSHYLDRGYIDFDITSTQVTITPDRESVYLVINIEEGDQYSVSSVGLSGELIVPEQELLDLITLQEGDVFSRRKITEISSAISDRLGEEGYAFANVNPIPKLDAENNTVALTFFVDPGNRVYVRRINITGNDKTNDEVIRRELRQMEGGWLSSTQLNRSRIRVQRLSYIGDVNLQTPSVPGSPDLVDIDLSVTERPSGSLMAGMGYSDGSGVSLNASVTMDNFLGTGKRVSAEVNASDVSKIYSFSHTDPYYTIDGVSRSFSVYFREVDTSETSLAEYATDVLGGSMTYGIPLSEFDTVRLGIGYENLTVKTTQYTPQSYLDFLGVNGEEYDLYKATIGWTHDTRNRTIFATEGTIQTVSAEVVLPSSDINFYKLTTRSNWLYPMTDLFTLSLEARLAYGDSYKDTSQLPFFEKFYAGGANSVRGYRSNSLGPREAGDPVGGDFRVIGSSEVIFPPPFAADSQTVRFITFFDIGNVYTDIDSYDSDEMRQSVGFGLMWMSPVGPLAFNLARPMNDEPQDETETFQFTLGTAF